MPGRFLAVGWGVWGVGWEQVTQVRLEGLFNWSTCLLALKPCWET